MNRRSFFKFLGIGAATAALAPKLLAEQTPEYYPEADYPITLDMLQTVFARTMYPIYADYSRSVTVDIGAHPFMSNKQFIEEAGRQAENKWRQSFGWTVLERKHNA